MGFRALAQRRYTAVLNLRTALENIDLLAEERLVRELGLKYCSVPVTGNAPEETQVTEFMRVMDELKSERVFVHCATANRVGSLMMIKRTLRDGLSPEEAEDEAGRIGLRSDVVRKFACDYVSRNADRQFPRLRGHT